jgi:RimJ/RimL family protein N-acetyltransferase
MHRARGKRARRVLVSMGATDPTNATAKVLAALGTLDRDLSIDVVLGRGALHISEIRGMVGPRGRLHIDPTDLPQLVTKADIAIGSAGSSSFERACLGLPAIIAILADNQVDLASAFEKAGAARVVAGSCLDRADYFARVISQLLDDNDARDAMSDCAAALVDGRGPQRLLVHLAGARTANGGLVGLRAAEIGDREWLLDLQSRPETRRFARYATPPIPPEHAAWMMRTLNDPDRLLVIVEWAGKPVGMVRLDRMPQEASTFEVSIAIMPEYNGRGIGTAALALVRKIVPSADLVATVLAGNLSSQLLFARAGYRRETEERFRSAIA